MLQFIVLGLVPGTNIQVTFLMILVLSLSLLLVVLLALEWRHFKQKIVDVTKDKTAAAA